jgi:hypothetical protein
MGRRPPVLEAHNILTKDWFKVLIASLRNTNHIFFNKADDLSEVLIQNENLWIR